MADDDVAAERARLEALAWGAGVPAEDALRARQALQSMRFVPSGDGAAPARSGGATRPDGSPAAGRSGGATGPDELLVSAGRSGGATRPDGPLAPDSRLVPGPGPDAAAGADPGGSGDRLSDGGGDDLGGSRLPAGPARWRTRAARLLGTHRPRIWIALGAAATIGVAFAAGTIVGTASEQTASAPTVTPTAGTITLEDLLDAPQTYADQLPGPVEAPVSLHSTRLIFTNRALDGSAFETPWSVWAGVGTDRSTICLVATANRIESTSACYPRDDALHRSVSLSAQSLSGTLTLTIRGGGVQGTVTNEN